MFRLSDHPILMNVKSREHLMGISSNLAQTSTWTQNFLEFSDQRSKVKVTVTSFVSFLTTRYLKKALTEFP